MLRHSMHYAYKLQREWKREWNRLTGNLIIIILPYACSICLNTHITHAACSEYNIFYSAKYNRTERLCIIYDDSELLRTIHLRCMLCYILIQDATIRPVLKHGPRSSTGLRVVEFITKLQRHSESKLVPNAYSICKYCSTGWLRICVELAVRILLSFAIKD